MNYVCKCTIKSYAKATCQYLVEVPTYRTYKSGWKNQIETKTSDSVIRYCSDGTNYCPHQVDEEIKIEIEVAT